MSKLKLKEDELKGLQEAIQKVNNFQMQIGGLETQKHQILNMILDANDALQTIQIELEESYGKVKVDVTTGEITEDEEHSPKD
jgi:hypothetical protein